MENKKSVKKMEEIRPTGKRRRDEPKENWKSAFGNITKKVKTWKEVKEFARIRLSGRNS